MQQITWTRLQATTGTSRLETYTDEDLSSNIQSPAKLPTVTGGHRWRNKTYTYKDVREESRWIPHKLHITHALLYNTILHNTHTYTVTQTHTQ